VLKQDAKRHLCFVAGGMNVPASVVITNGLIVNLDLELADPAAVNTVGLARLIMVLYPVVTLGVFFLVLGLRDADNSFAPHFLRLLYRHLEGRDEGVFVASEVGVALL